MEGRRVLRTAACFLIICLAVLDVLEVQGRSVSHDDEEGKEGVRQESNDHRQHHQDRDHLRRRGGRRDDEAKPGVPQLAERIEYDVGDPEFPVKVDGGSEEEEAERGEAGVPPQWEVISSAAQAIGRAVQLQRAQVAAQNIGNTVKAVAATADDLEEDDRDVGKVSDKTKGVVYVDEDDGEDDDEDDDGDDLDEDDDDDDDDDSEWDDEQSPGETEDSDDLPHLKNPHFQEDLNQGDGEEGEVEQKHITNKARQNPLQHVLRQHPEDLPVVTPDVYTDDEMLKIEGTPAPALITNEEGDGGQELLLLDTDRLMGDDSAAAERLLRDEGARPRKEFKPVRMPTRFESYDVEPADGVITLQELVNITGAKVNVHKAFNASDKNGDGFLDRNEFYAAPWELGPNWRHIPEQEVELSKDTSDSSSDEEEEDEYDEDEDYDADDEDDDEDYEEWDEWNTLDDDPEFWDDVEDADIF